MKAIDASLWHDPNLSFGPRQSARAFCETAGEDTAEIRLDLFQARTSRGNLLLRSASLRAARMEPGLL